MANLAQVDGTEYGDEALELMEQALAILVAMDADDAACSLQYSIDQMMQLATDPEAENEWWEDDFDELPHLTHRTLFLHRQNGLTIDHIARRLRIDRKEAAERLSSGLRCVREAAFR